MLNVSIKELRDSIAVLKEKQREIVAYITEQKEENVDGTLLNEVGNIKSTLQSMNVMIGNVSARVDEEAGKVATIDHTVKDVQSAQTTAAETVNGLGTDLEDVTGRVDTLEGTVKGLNGTVEGLSTTVEGLSDRVTVVECLNTTIEGIDGRLTTVEGLGSTVSGLSTTVSGIDGRLTTIETSLETLSGSVDTKIETAKTAVTKAINGTIETEVAELTQMITAQNTRIDEFIADIDCGLTDDQLEDVQEKINVSIATIQTDLTTVSSKIDDLLKTLTKEVEDAENTEDVPIDATIPTHPAGDEINGLTDLSVIMSPSILELRNDYGIAVADSDGNPMFSVERLGDKVAVIDQAGQKVNMLIGETVEVNKIQINGTAVNGVDTLLNASSSANRVPTSAAVVDYVSKVVALTGTNTRSVDSVPVDGVPSRSIPEPVVTERVIEKVDYDVIEQKIDQKVTEKVNVVRIDEQMAIKVAEKVSAKVDARMDQLKTTVQQEVKTEAVERAVEEPVDAAYVIEPVDGSIKLTSPESKLMINDNALIMDETGPVFITAQQSYALVSNEGNLCILEEDVSGDVAGRFVEYTGTIFTITSNGQTIYAPGVVMTQKLSSATAGVCGKLITDQRYIRNGIVNELPTSDRHYITVVRDGYMKIPIDSVKNITGDELLLGELLIPGPNGYPTISSVHDAAIKFANKSRVPLMKIVADTADRCLIIEVI